MNAARRLALAGALLAGTAAAVDDTVLAQCAAVADATARLACYDALAGRPADPAAAPPVPGSTPADFGKPKPEPQEARSLDARVVGSVKGWGPGTVFRLDNGQSWKVIGEENAFYPGIPENPEVTLTKSLLGGYWMEIRAINRKVKVKRIS